MKNKHTIPIIILIAVSIAIFSNTLKNSFMWDDKSVIVKGRYVKDIKNIPFFFTPTYWKDCFLEKNREFIEGMAIGYRPIVMTSFALDFFIWQFNPFGYHLTNLLLHIFNVILIYFLIHRLGGAAKKKLLLAFLTAVFFASHPIHTESVSWIKNRSDLLSLLFFLMSLLFFIKHRLQERAESRLSFYTGSVLFFILALFSKAIAVTLPLILVLYVICFLSKGERKVAIEKTSPFFILLVLYLIFKVDIIGRLGSTDNIPNIDFYPNVLAIIKTLGLYLKLLILPVNLNVERSFAIPGSLFEKEAISSLVLLFLAVVAVIKNSSGEKREYSKMITFGILWILVTIMPVSNIIFLYARPIAEQRLYIPSLGFCLLLGMGVSAISSLEPKTISRNALRGITILLSAFIVLFYSNVTIKRNLDWRDSVTFWSKTVKDSPRSFRALNNLATSYEESGQHNEAVREYKKAIEMNPDEALTHNNLGVTYKRMGMNKEAILEFKKAIELRPEYGEAYSNLGAALRGESHQVEEVIGYYQKAIELTPSYAEAYNNLGAFLYAEMGDFYKAEKLCKKAIELRPYYDQAYYNLGLIYTSLGLYEKAVMHYQKAIELNPEYADAYNSLGALIYNKKLGQIDEAMRLCKKAIELNPDYADAYYNFGLMLNTIGLHEDAVMYCERAIEFKPDNVDAYNSLGIAYRYLGQYEKAIESFEKAIEVKPDYLAAYNNLALVYYYDKKLFDLAKSQWEKILEMDPLNKTARKGLEYLEKEKE